MTGARPRVFLGLVEVAGNFSGLKRGFDELGVTSILVDTLQHRFGYSGAESRHGLVRVLQWVTRRRVAARGNERILSILWLVFQFILQGILMAWAVRRYDVFVFTAGHSFFEGYDLPLLRFLRKRVIHLFTGSDSRPPYLAPTRHRSSREMVRRARWLKARLRRIERHSDFVINSPFQAHFHERPVLIFQVMGIAQPFEPVVERPGPARGPGVRILHSPSHPEGKGTGPIRQAIRNLLAAGMPIHYVEVIGKPNAVVCAELAAADLVIDEIYSDVHMATFAAEAARFGKASVVGGYGQKEFEAFLPPGFIPPVYHCRPEEVEEAVRDLVSDPVRREELGRKARDFVRSVWSPAEVARRYLRVMQGDIPPQWWFDPRRLRYVAGWGLTLEGARERIRRVLAEGGRDALQVGDKPELERALVDFAESRRHSDAPSGQEPVSS